MVRREQVCPVWPRCPTTGGLSPVRPIHATFRGRAVPSGRGGPLAPGASPSSAPPAPALCPHAGTAQQAQPTLALGFGLVGAVFHSGVRSVSAAVSAGLWGPWLVPQHPPHRARAGLLARCRCRTHTSLGAESVVSWLADPARTRRHTAHGRGP